jgi:hypothetical protein
MLRQDQTRLGLTVALAFAFTCADARAQSATPGSVDAQTDERPPTAEAPASEPLDFTNEPATPQGASGPVAAPVEVPLPAPHAPSEARPVETPKPALLRPNAINLSVVGFVIGNVRLTYERMLRAKHGVFAEAIVAPDVLRGFDFVGVGAGAGYRFHWHGAGTRALWAPA